jgi:hypothetical protein
MYIFGLYTFASVFTARIAIEQSRTLATSYAAVLGIATLGVTMRFVQFSGALAPFSIPATIGFLVLIAYLADRITHDCTLIDDASDGSSEGLLQSLGMVRGLLSDQDRKKNRKSETVLPNSTPTDEATSGNTKTLKKKRHNPGVWIVYFSFFAIPLFGLGQMVIPSWDRARNQAAFVFLAGYLYCTLSLLVVTSLLSLRRYLRRRRIDMPLGMTATWFFSGIVGIIAVLGLLSLISLPSSSTGLFSLPFTITSPEGIQPSPHGWGPEGVPKEGAQAEKGGPRQEAANKEQNVAPKANHSDKPSNESQDSSTGKAKPESGSERSELKNNSNSPPSKPEASNPNSSDARTTQPAPEENSPEKTSESTPNQPPPDQPKSDEKVAQQGEPGNQGEQGERAQPEKPNKPIAPKDEMADAKSPPNNSGSWSIALTGGLADLTRWLLMVALAIFVAYCCIRYRSDIANAWRQFLQSVLAFFQIPNETIVAIEGSPESTSQTSPSRTKLFADFDDPFQQNRTKWTPTRIVSHTFLAIEQWGCERNIPRQTNETAEEYLARLASRFPIQQESFQRLTGLYNRLAYAAKPVEPSESNQLQSLWRWLKGL